VPRELSDTQITAARPEAGNARHSSVAVVHKPRPTVNICSPDIRPPRKLSRASALARVGYGGMYPGRGQMSSTSSDDVGAYSHAPLNM